MTRLTAALLHLYPWWWRTHYAEEVRNLTAELLAEPGAHPARILLGLLGGVPRAWLRVKLRGRYMRPVGANERYGSVPNGSHRDVLGRRGLSAQSAIQLRDGEELLGVLYGCLGRPSIVKWRGLSVAMLVGALVTLLLEVASGWSIVEAWHMAIPRLEVYLAFYTASRIGAWLTHSVMVAVAVTDQGLVLFRRTLLGRTGKVIGRLPAVDPVLIEWTSSWRRVQLGNREMWLWKTSDPLLTWMSHAVRAR